MYACVDRAAAAGRGNVAMFSIWRKKLRGRPAQPPVVDWWFSLCDQHSQLPWNYSYVFDRGTFENPQILHQSVWRVCKVYACVDHPAGCSSAWSAKLTGAVWRVEWPLTFCFSTWTVCCQSTWWRYTLEAKPALQLPVHKLLKSGRPILLHCTKALCSKYAENYWILDSGLRHSLTKI